MPRSLWENIISHWSRVICQELKTNDKRQTTNDKKQMTNIDLAFTPALEQARLIRDRVVSPLELVQLYLERIARLDGQLGSYFSVMAEQAIADAKAKTEQLANQTSEIPPFFGVPISIKDLYPVAGVPCTYGISALKDRLAEYDFGQNSHI